jgi:hypothetical protein
MPAERVFSEAAMILAAKQEAWDREQEALKEALNKGEITEGEYLKRRAAAYSFYFNQTTNDVIAGLNDMVNALEGFGEKSKALALVKIGIDTAQAISSLVAASEANILNPITFGGAAIIQYGMGIIRILTNMLTARKYLISGKKGMYTGGEIDEDSGLMLTKPTPMGDNMLILAKKGEVIVNQTQQRYIGNDAFRSAGVPGFAAGGRVGVGSAGINYTTGMDPSGIIRKLDDISMRLTDIEVYVNINEILDASKKYAKIRSGTSL